MRLSLRLAVAVLAVAVAAPLASAATPRAKYLRALEREEAVRPALAAPNIATAALAEARRVIKAYERIVSAHPASGYTDNALWQAAKLAADLWAETGDDGDRVAATGLYKRLIAGYPASSLVAQARLELARLQRVKAAPRNAAREDRVIAVPPPATLRVRDVAPPAAASPSAAAPASPPDAAEPAPAAGDRATIRDIKRVTLAGIMRVMIELDREVTYREERIGNPDRVFLDLRATEPRAGLRATQTFSDGAVRQIRVGQRPDSSTRVVLEVDGKTRHSVFALYDPYRLVIDCELPAADASPARASAGPEPLPLVTPHVPVANRAPAADTRPMATATKGTPVSALPPTRPRGSGKTASISRPDKPLATRSTEDITEAVAGAPILGGTPSVNLEGGFSLSRQLGLGIARVVIDPGHGGHDPGARAKGLTEADVVLDVALRLEQLLLKQPGVDVMLTRRTDVFIPLEERTELANREDADLFLSIHANAHRSPKARGVETYFLNFASNPDAQAVAARENAASGRTMHSLPDIVRAITLNNKLDESRDFATLVQRAMIDRLRAHDVRDLGVKQAPFVVLIGAGMPSVLAEISFVTNPQEGKLLKANAYRQRIAEALFDGVAQYQRALKNVRTAANQ
ncbi:MAG TPA: N-acetylmuramoyl-L-alanine amidase [Vicinamibacterales bacterium]|nr:N-acetylmuramoyl-L-alanine amidase [Vicinamibacterales bacterium]